MDIFETSLLREKFTILDLDTKNPKPVIALSNRMAITLTNKEARDEQLIIRTHNMHSCIRFAARLVQSHAMGGAIMTRAAPFDWEAAWDAVVNDFERSFNPQRWVCVYYNGGVVFEYGERNPFVDLVEKCDFENDQEYDYAIPMAENALKKTGKTVSVSYDANVALSTSFKDNKGRCGIIFRAPNRTTTFNFSAEPLPKSEDGLSIPRCLSTAAAFLEGVQLAFTLGMDMEKSRLGIIERFSREEKQFRESGRRLNRLSNEISGFNEGYNVRYRPEQPDFRAIQAEAEELAVHILVPPEEAGDVVE